MSITVVTTRDGDGAPSAWEVFADGVVYKIGDGNLNVLSAAPRMLGTYPSGNWMSVYLDDSMRVVGKDQDGAGDSDTAAPEVDDQAGVADATDADLTDGDVDTLDTDAADEDTTVPDADVDADAGAGGADVDADAGAGGTDVDADAGGDEVTAASDGARDGNSAGTPKKRHPAAAASGSRRTDTHAKGAGEPKRPSPRTEELARKKAQPSYDNSTSSPWMRPVVFRPRVFKAAQASPGARAAAGIPDNRPSGMRPIVFRPRVWRAAQATTDPDVETSEVEAPDVETPEVETPEVETPAESADEAGTEPG